MRAVVVRQPHAELIRINAKHIETRPRRCQLGPLVIVAGQYPYGAQALSRAIYDLRPSDDPVIHTHAPDSFYGYAIPALYQYHQQRIGTFIPELLLGFAVCVVYVTACIRTEELTDISPQERAFGDYTPGRWGWILERIEAFPEPMKVTGKLGVLCTDPYY